MDRDGNGMAGIRLPEVEVPTATYAGWNLRAVGYAKNEIGMSGSYILFSQTRVERLAKGNPHLSLEERHPTHGDYGDKITNATNKLVQKRLLLEEDAQLIINAVARGSIGCTPK